MSATSNSANGAMLSAHATEIETYTGKFVDVANPLMPTIDLRDIAQGLSLTCRYGGQINRFYSVAEHSVLVHDLLRWQDAPRVLQLAGLFHDAAEAYLGDVVAPLKYAQRAAEFDYPGAIHRASTLPDFKGAYSHLTAQMDDAIAARFNLDSAWFDHPDLRTADMWALRIEARKLTHTGGQHWRWPGQLPNQGELPGDVQWHGGRRPRAARAHWLRRCASHGIRP